MWVQRLVHELRLLLVAVQFLTRVPVPRWVGFKASWLNECARHLPLVGLGIGAFGALIWCAAAQVWPPTVAVLLSMVATVWLTGGFHEDGLSDTCDALGGAVSRDKALLIMKDSRIGAYGAISLVLMLGLKAATLSGAGAPPPGSYTWSWLRLNGAMFSQSRAAASVSKSTRFFLGSVALLACPACSRRSWV